MPPDPAVILTTHCREEQIPHNPMYQQIIEQKQMISSLQNQLSVQQEKMSALEVNVKNLTNSFNERINEKIAEGTSTFCEKVEKLEEVIPSMNSRITSLINNSISSEGLSSLINNSMIKFGGQEDTIQILKTQVDDVGAQLTKIEDNIGEKIGADLKTHLVNNIDMIDDQKDEIRNEVKKSEQTFSKKLSTFGISLDNVEEKIESKLNHKLVSNICSVGEKIGADLNQKLVSNIDNSIDKFREEMKKNEQIYSKKLTDIAIKIRTDIKELKENERTLRQKLSEVIVKTQSQHPTRTKYYN